MLVLHRFLAAIENLIAGLAFLAVILLVLGEILARELFGTTLFGSSQMAVLAAAIAGFVGYAMVTRADRHLRISAFDALVPASLAPVMARVGHVTALFLHLYLAWLAYHLVVESAGFNDRVEVLLIARWPFQSVLIFAFVSAAFSHLVYAIYPDEIPKVTGHVPEKSE